MEAGIYKVSFLFFFRRFINDFYETHFIFKKGELYGSRRF